MRMATSAYFDDLPDGGTPKPLTLTISLAGERPTHLL